MTRKRETRGGARPNSGPKPFVATEKGDRAVQRGFKVSLALWGAATAKAEASGTTISAILRDALKSFMEE